jgi:hypothetical protein
MNSDIHGLWTMRLSHMIHQACFRKAYLGTWPLELAHISRFFMKIETAVVNIETAA